MKKRDEIKLNRALAIMLDYIPSRPPHNEDWVMVLATKFYLDGDESFRFGKRRGKWRPS